MVLCHSRIRESSSHCSHCLHHHPLRLVLLVPPSPLRISQMFLHHRNHPSYTTRAEEAEMYIPPPCLIRAFQPFSPTLPCCIQATRSRRSFTHRWQILTLHNRAAPQAPLCNRDLWKRNKRKRSIVKPN